MRDIDAGCLIFFIFVGFMASAVGFTALGRRYERRLAVEAGVAYYIGDPLTGKSTFTYKTPTK